MTLFLKYPSLTNAHSVQNSRLLSSYLFGDNKEVEFYGTEKIDGSNIQLSFDTQTGEYEFFKRSGSFDSDEKPFNSISNIISEQEVNNIIDTFIATYPQFKNKVHIYGELFGSKIQKQDYDICKSNKRSIRFYDIIVGGETEDEELTELGLLDLQKVIPNKFLPHLVESGNKKYLSDWLKDEPSETSFYGGINEGYVYKMVDSHTFMSNSPYIGIKQKTDAYLEVAKVPKHINKVHQVANPELVNDISRYVTEQRVMNIVSHGDAQLEFKDFGKLMKLMSEDIIKEYTRDENTEGYTDEDIRTAVNKGINKITATLIRQTIQSNQVLD